eukprot:XP_014773072.1 PREDICTED: sulfide:quinone oxidoreductase, mitochondrial-like [Octopus bimaculoides]
MSVCLSLSCFSAESKEHYYQPLWTLVGGGLKKLEDSKRTMASVIPPNCEWINDSVVGFDPDNNFVTLKDGSKVYYEYLVLALGLQLNFDWVKGLPEALMSDPRICSNYSVHTVGKTFSALQSFEGGNAIFTVPATPIKCGGAPQKIMYLAEEYFNKTGKRDKANILFNTSLGVMFVVKHYSEKLYEIAKNRGIHVNFMHSLIEVRPESGEAIFKKLNSESGETATFKSCDLLFSASQCGVLSKNLMAKMKGQKDLQSKYTGYTSCPLVTSSSKCILAEFDFTNTPTETFPFDQSKERRSMFLLKSHVLPPMYWFMMTKGWWHGPAVFRKIFNFWRN